MGWLGRSEPPGEPSFALRFQQIKARIHGQIVEMVDLSKLTIMTERRLRRDVRQLADKLVKESPDLLSAPDRERMIDELMDEVFGFGPLEPLMKDATISDILVNGWNEVWVERRGVLKKTDVVFADNNHVMQIIQRIAARVGRRTDEMSPMVDARMPDGSRVNAIIPPLSLRGPVLSIRRFGTRLQGDDLIANGTTPPEIMQFLQAAVEGRISTVVSGGTGSGKTTMLNVVSKFIPNDERLVTIEDSAELKLQQDHVISLETRPANLEGVGQVTQRDLLRNSLRMRPDRIIIGECRGAEALDMLQAMNTGHEGSLTTVHANDTRDALTRLEMMVMLTGFEIPVPVIRHYIATAVTLIVQLARLKGGRRRLMRVTEILGTGPEGYITQDIFGFRQTGVRDGQAVGEFFATGATPRCLERIHAAGVDLPESLFVKRTLAAGDAEPAVTSGGRS